jgi:hypothetical protein
MTNIVVCGSRNWTNIDLIKEQILRIVETSLEITIWQGGATGADSIARRIAEDEGIDCVTVHANWKKYGKAAGPMRNAKMLELAKPSILLSFPKNGSKGTADMINRANKFPGSIHVRIFGG